MNDVAGELAGKRDVVLGGVGEGALSGDDDVAGAGVGGIGETNYISGIVVIEKLSVVTADGGVVGEDKIEAASGRDGLGVEDKRDELRGGGCVDAHAALGIFDDDGAHVRMPRGGVHDKRGTRRCAS